MTAIATKGVSRPNLKHRGRLLRRHCAQSVFLIALSIGLLDIACARIDKDKKDPLGQLVDLQLLTFNAFHSHLEPDASIAIEGMAAGGADFTTFVESNPALRSDSGTDLDALINHFDTFSPLAPPSTDHVCEQF